MSALGRTDRIVFSAVAVFTVLAGVAYYGGWNSIVAFGFATIAAAWSTMYQARGNTKPLATMTWVTTAVFFVVTAPLMLTIGTMGYAYGMLAAMIAVVVDPERP